MADPLQIPLTPEQATETPTLTVTVPLIHEPPPIDIPAPPLTEPLPAPPGAPEALPDIVNLGMLVLILALIALASALNDFLNWLFGFVLRPFTRGRAVTQPTTFQFTQKLSNVLGTAYSKIDADIGFSFFKLAGLTARFSSAIVAGEQAAYTAATRIAALSGATRSHSLTAGNALQQAQQARQAAAQAQAATLAAQAGAQERAKSIDARLAALETHVTTLIEPELNGLRHLIPELEHGVTTALDGIKQHGEALGIAGVTAATAVALSRLGAGWVSCEANKVLGEAACRSGPQNMQNLLSLLTGAGALLGFEEYVRLMQPLTRGTTETISTLLRV